LPEALVQQATYRILNPSKYNEGWAFAMLYMDSPKRTERHVVVPSKLHRWRVAFVLGMCAAVLFLGTKAKAQATPPSESVSHARVSLIVENASTPPGKPLWVGLLFQLDPGWHIYWQNPGDSGEPPKVQWELPEGFRAGEIRWPVPIRLGSGSVIDYGYEGHVLLMVPIERSPGARGDSASPIAADVKYVVCREICIPGKAHLTVSSPAGIDTASQASEWRKLFQEARAQLPRAAPANWKVSAQSGKNDFYLTVAGVRPSRNVSFFPLRAGLIENSAEQKVAARHDGFQLSLRKSENFAGPVSELAGILVLDGRGYTVNARVVATYELTDRVICAEDFGCVRG
jgi:DsbC/DsbD-like thiol-disulfide interchange protein